MTEARKSEHDHLSEARERLLDAALPHVVFDGWSKAALDAATAESGVDPGLARLALPRGGIDMVAAFHRRADRRLAGELAGADLATMRMRERITHCVRRRIELIAEQREAVRRGAALLALPIHAPEGARLVWETADIIWNACGDTATDYNWYTKRMSLGAVYSATMLYWLGDASPGFANSWAFLDRRIDDVMRIEKAKARIEENPILRAATWVPRQLLGLIRAPGAAGAPDATGAPGEPGPGGPNAR
ncbi:MAG TPA: COQ9 family protein [Thermohalobaculum sp.]|nr:COQ9 family protein [Thermohalobaculum sp.]